MNELHIHEILRMMMEDNKTYVNKADFTTDIREKFGANTVFSACSNNGMDADMAFEFLMQKGKIRIDNTNNVSLDPEITMCDENNPHHHH